MFVDEKVDRLKAIEKKKGYKFEELKINPPEEQEHQPQKLKQRKQLEKDEALQKMETRRTQ